MTSAIKTRRARVEPRPAGPAGFTLLEVILAIILIGIIVGVGAAFSFSSQSKRKIVTATSRVEAMASRGHAMAILHQKPFWLRFEPGRVVLAGADIRPALPEDEDGNPSEAWEEQETGMETVYDTFETEAEIGLRRWGAKPDDWFFPEVTPTGFTSTSWNFQSSGLCEPVSLRVELEESWVEMHMHPLTARVDEEDMEIK